MTTKVARNLEQAGDRFRPRAAWSVTINGSSDQVLACTDEGVALVTDDGVLLRPWAGVATVDSSAGGGLERTHIAFADGARRTILHNGPTDRADFLALLPAGLLDLRPIPPAPAAGPGHETVASRRPADPGTGVNRSSATLAGQAAAVAGVLDLLAVLVLIGGMLLTAAAAFSYLQVADPLGFPIGALVAALLGAIITAFNWAALRLGSIVAKYICLKSSTRT